MSLFNDLRWTILVAAERRCKEKGGHEARLSEVDAWSGLLEQTEDVLVRLRGQRQGLGAEALA
ncbi:MAG TPA: hypothetical protein VHB19_06295, partial [Devosia sp.]|nr:hypothetical protein [Devosia sp.]